MPTMEGNLQPMTEIMMTGAVAIVQFAMDIQVDGGLVDAMTVYLHHSVVFTGLQLTG